MGAAERTHNLLIECIKVIHMLKIIEQIFVTMQMIQKLAFDFVFHRMSHFFRRTVQNCLFIAWNVPFGRLFQLGDFASDCFFTGTCG